MSAGPTVTVVIPTYNRRARLHRVLTALADQSDPEPIEVVVVSDGADDGTDEYLVSDEIPLKVVAVRQNNQGPATARNTGIERATGEVILFIDDDVVPDRDLVAAHRNAHARLGENAVVIGPMLNPSDHPMTPWIRWEQAMLAKQYAAMERGDWEPSSRQFYTGNASVRREHLVAAGGFDSSFRRAEDVELAYRLEDRELSWSFEPAAIGLHYAERTYAAWRQMAHDYGRNDVVFARDRGRRFVYGWIEDDLRQRPWPMRQLMRVCVPHRRLSASVSAVLRVLATVSDRVRVDAVTQAALSVIYALAYYRGVVDELGDPDALRTLLRADRRRDTR